MRELRAHAPKTILVVEDNPDIQRLLLRGLPSSYRIVAAFDGESAIAHAERERPDLILLDLYLPNGDGYSVLRRLAAVPELARIPVAVISAAGYGHAAQSRDAGAAAFIEKPLDLRRLAETVEQLLEGTARPVVAAK
jgi:CheY-like chemotaxis protein